MFEPSVRKNILKIWGGRPRIWKKCWDSWNNVFPAMEEQFLKQNTFFNLFLRFGFTKFSRKNNWDEETHRNKLEKYSSVRNRTYLKPRIKRMEIIPALIPTTLIKGLVQTRCRRNLSCHMGSHSRCCWLVKISGHWHIRVCSG